MGAVCVCTRCLRAVCRSGFLKKRKKLERQKGEKKEKRLESEDSFQRRRDPRVQVKECTLLSSSIFNVSDEIYRTTRNMFFFSCLGNFKIKERERKKHKKKNQRGPCRVCAQCL